MLYANKNRGQDVINKINYSVFLRQCQEASRGKC